MNTCFLINKIIREYAALFSVRIANIFLDHFEKMKQLELN